jgi:hypothetical protein
VRTSTKDVQVEVAHGLPAIVSDIRDHPIAGILDALQTRNLRRSEEECPGSLGIAGIKGGERIHMGLRDHKDVDRSLGVHVPKGQDRVGLENRLRRNLTAHDPTEDAGCRRHGSLPLLFQVVSFAYGKCPTLARTLAKKRTRNRFPPAPTEDPVSDLLTPRAVTVLERHPAPALSVNDLRSLLALEGISAPAGTPLAAVLGSQGELFRVVNPRPRSRWTGSGERAWILARRRPRPDGAQRLSHRLRESLLRIGEAIPVRSPRALARWERFLMEEEAVRGALGRVSRHRHRDVVRRLRSTTPLPDPPR